MAIRIGASCVIDDGGSTDDCAVDEVRFEKNDRFNSALNWVKHDLSVGKYVIANITMWDRKNFIEPPEREWRNFCNHVAHNITKVGANSANCRLTIDNEPMKHLTKEQYAWYVNIAYDELKLKKNYKFDIGAGNEEFDLAFARGDMYDYLLRMRAQGLCNFDVLDIHIQSSCNTSTKLERWKNWIIAKKTMYGMKRISCTEANWMDIATQSGYEMLLRQLESAEEIGCEDFCVVFITLTGVEKYKWLSFIYDNKVRSGYWEDFKQVIKAKKPVVEEEDMKLEKIYKRGSRGLAVKFIQRVVEEEFLLDDFTIDGIFGAKTEEAVKEYQRAKNLKVDGIVGPKTFKIMVLEYPQFFNLLVYEYAIGER